MLRGGKGGEEAKSPFSVFFCVQKTGFSCYQSLQETFCDYKDGSFVMSKDRKPILALFYCQHTPQSSEQDKQALEAKYGKSLRLFPMPCSGRIEPLHLLRALEEFADAAYVICCPAQECRYFDGNLRAKKRVQRVREDIMSLGFQGYRIGIVMNSKEKQESLAKLTDEIVDTIAQLKPLPILNPQG
jgi:F420-non-reducing hydrogenase iron-sulfur subunit